MKSAIICLGSNTPDASQRIERAIDFLSRLVEIQQRTSLYKTPAEYVPSDPCYTNCIVQFRAKQGLETLIANIKAYEHVERSNNKEQGVAIDIDVVEYDGVILRPRDASSTYYRRGMQLLINEQ